MKNLILLIGVVGILYLELRPYSISQLNQNAHEPPADTGKYILPNYPWLCIVFFQDVTGSDTVNGVEIINSTVFAPYYNCTQRNIELHFGCITGYSAQKLISVSLQAFPFIRPVCPDLTHVSITTRAKLQGKYNQALNDYLVDSLQYYKERQELIKVFAYRVDTMLQRYKDKLCDHTDIRSAVIIADKIFSGSNIPGTKQYLLINGDGLDSYYKTMPVLKNKVTVFLSNADSITNTSIDNILTGTYEAPEMAIAETLK